jgi:hypothetical protein
LIRNQGGQLTPLLNPSADVLLQADDALLLLAPDYQQAQQRLSEQAFNASESDTTKPSQADRAQQKHILIAGWSRKVPALLREFSSYPHDQYHITIMSSRPVAEREQLLKTEGVDSPRITLAHIVAEVTNEVEWRNLDLSAYDSIVLMSSDRLSSGEEADARSIVGYLHLESVLQKAGKHPQLLLEFSDPSNERLLGHRAGEVIISPLLLSHLLVHVALRRELLVAIDDLFSAGGPEISFRTLSDYDLQAGDLQTGTITFADIRQLAWNRNETALGIYHASAATMASNNAQLNPPLNTPLQLEQSDLIVVIETYPES